MGTSYSGPVCYINIFSFELWVSEFVHIFLSLHISYEVIQSLLPSTSYYLFSLVNFVPLFYWGNLFSSTKWLKRRAKNFNRKDQRGRQRDPRCLDLSKSSGFLLFILCKYVTTRSYKSKGRPMNIKYKDFQTFWQIFWLLF